MGYRVSDIASKIAAEIFTSTTVFTIDPWIKELEAVYKIKVHPVASHVMVIESTYYAMYCVHRKCEGVFGDQQELFKEELKKWILFSLSRLYFKTPEKEEDMLEHEKKTADLFNGHYFHAMKEYGLQKGSHITGLLYDRILDSFRECDLKIKFVEYTFRKRVALNLAIWLNVLFGSEPLFKEDTVILDLKVLESYSKSIEKLVSEIDVDRIVSWHEN